MICFVDAALNLNLETFVRPVWTLERRNYNLCSRSNSRQAHGTTCSIFVPSVAFLKLELLCHKYFPGICPGEGMGSVSVVLFDIEHGLINQFLF